MEAQLLNLELPTLGSGNNPRSSGLHLSDVIKDLLVTSGVELYPKDSKWNTQPTRGAGFVWEEVLQNQWEDTFSPAFAKLLGRKFNWYQTGELHLDGITGTPDGLDLPVWVLQEAKFTWKSTKTKPEDRLNWMIQAKSYLKMLNSVVGATPPQVVFHVFYCMGDYRGSGPAYQPWLITFQPHEIEENWQMIRNHAEYMKSHDAKVGREQ